MGISSNQKYNNVIFRAVVGDKGKISYHNSKGENITFQTYNEGRKDAILLFGAVNKYFTGKSPNITPEEQVQLREDIARNAKPIYGGSDNRLDIYKGIDYLLNTYSAPASDGGENITPNEVYKMFEIFHKWTES